MSFTPATRKRVKARLAFVGMSKSGKSYTALATLRGIVGPQGRIAAIDTENGALSLYAGLFPGERQPTGFDVQVLSHFSPDSYIAAIKEAIDGRYDGLLIDSASHEWMGSGGILEMVDAAPSNDKFFSGWKGATPKHNGFVWQLVSAPFHLVVTMRQKDDYVIETINGKNTPVKVGTEAIQRKGTEYEFNLVATLDLDHTMRVQHSCIDFMPNGTIVELPDGLALGTSLAKWLNKGNEDWQPPQFKKAFYVNDREIISGGIERQTYLTALNLGAKLDKVTKPGTAKKLMGAKLADLTEEQGAELLVKLTDTIEKVESADKQAKSA